VRPRDSLTTLNPNETTRSMKNDMELRPASSIDTDKPVNTGSLYDREREHTDDKEDA
jgi:hypothetical protein